MRLLLYCVLFMLTIVYLSLILKGLRRCTHPVGTRCCYQVHSQSFIMWSDILVLYFMVLTLGGLHLYQSIPGRDSSLNNSQPCESIENTDSGSTYALRKTISPTP